MYINHVFHFLKYVFLYVLLFLKYIKPWSCQFAIMNDLLVLVILSNTHIIYITAWETIFKLSSKRLPSDIMTYWVFSSPVPKVHVNYCHHLASVVCRLSTFHISSFFSETTGPIGTKLSRNVPWMVLYKVFCSSWIFNMAARANNMLWLAEISTIFFSETNELTEPKL